MSPYAMFFFVIVLSFVMSICIGLPVYYEDGPTQAIAFQSRRAPSAGYLFIACGLKQYNVPSVLEKEKVLIIWSLSLPLSRTGLKLITVMYYHQIFILIHLIIFHRLCLLLALILSLLLCIQRDATYYFLFLHSYH